jgi:hypothetical protein
MVNALQTLGGAKGGMSSPALLKILVRKLAITVNLILFLY